MSNYSIKLQHVELWRVRTLRAAAQVLRRGKVVRLSPFDITVLGGLGVLAAGAASYLFGCAFAPVASAVAPNPDWRPPVAAAPARPAIDPLSRRDTQTLSRPLFEKSRRPGAKKANDEAPSPGPPGSDSPPAGMVLRGVAGFGEETRVFIVTTAQLEGVWLKIGEKLEGWTIESAQESGVVLRRGERKARLEFDYAEAPTGPTAGGVPFAPPEPPRPPKLPKPKRGAGPN